MPKITFVETSGARHSVNVGIGMSAMEAAIAHGVPGIDGDCGGNAACATCHVIVDESWEALVGDVKSESEVDLLDLTDGVTRNSRLACQVILNDAMDGLVLHLPDNQF